MVSLSIESFEKIVQNPGKVVVEFYSPQCTQCPAMERRLEDMEKKFPSSAVFCKINTMTVPEVVSSVGVMSVPSVLIYEDGEEKFRICSLGQVAKVLDFIRG